MAEQKQKSPAEETQRLKADFAKRQHSRPMSHSVAVAYRQLIARQETRQKS